MVNQVTVRPRGHRHVIPDVVAKAGILNLNGYRDRCRQRVTYREVRLN